MRLSIAMLLAATLAIACGGDSGTGPSIQPPPVQPPELPAGTATKVPRVLRLTSIDSNTVPMVNYRSADGVHAIRTDSATATVQSDSGIVLRIFGVYGDRAVPSDYWTAMSFTLGGRLQSTGLATAAADGYGAKIHVLANGAIVADVTIMDANAPHSFGTLTFATAYDGPLNLVPVITSISPSYAFERADSARLVITGSGFIPGTQVIWGRDSLLQTTYESSSRITAFLPGSYLGAPHTGYISLLNPQPAGGGTTREFHVVRLLPTITSLFPAVTPAGGGYFTLHVRGTNFSAGSTILWNGTAGTTVLVSTTELTRDVAGTDIEAPGTAQISVRTQTGLDTPAVATTGELSLSISGTPAQKRAEVIVPFAASELFADPARPLVYAVASSQETTRPHTVLALDPSTGQEVWSLDVGGTVKCAAISDDGQYLYLGRVADSTVERISLATHTVDETIPIGHGSAGAIGANALAVQPGNAHAIAVVVNGSPVKVAMYDDMVQRPDVTTGNGTPRMMAFTTPQMLTGIDLNGDVSSFSVSASGIAALEHDFINLGHVVYPFLVGPRLYTSTGYVYDVVAPAWKAMSSFVPATSVTSNQDGSLVYAADSLGLNLRAYDPVHDVEVGAVPLSGNTTQSGAGSMVRFGSDGVAFTTNTSVYFVRASFVR